MDTRLLAQTISDLRARGGDTLDVEAKRATGGTPDLKPTLCAFGNLPSGGVIILGLDEDDNFRTVGVHNVPLAEQAVASQARKGVVPPVQVEFTATPFEGETLLVVQVMPLPSAARPCFTKGKAYLRQSDGDYEMSAAEIAQMTAARERPRFDDLEVPGTSAEDLDPELLHDFIERVKSGSPRLRSMNDDEILRSKRVLGADGSLTRGGLYALGRYPQAHFPSFALTAAVSAPEGEGRRVQDLVHLDGPLPELLERAVEWVRRNTRTVVRFGLDGHGRDESEIPLVAVREIVANALVHRDLSNHTLGKRVEMRLKDDNLIVQNPGGLWGITVDQLGRGNGKSAVNEYLYEICKYVRGNDGIRVIEGEGGGIRAVGDSLKSAGLAPAHFQDEGVRFSVTLPRHGLLPPADIAWLRDLPEARILSDTQKAIAVSMLHGTAWTNPMVREEFPPMDSTHARALLQGLVKAGIARKEGERRNAQYVMDERLRGAYSRETAGVVSQSVHSESSTIQSQKPSITRNGDIVMDSLRQSPMTMSDLVQHTGLTRRQVGYALNLLVAVGLVIEGHSVSDSRVKRYRIAG